MQLRDYQVNDLERLRECYRRGQNPILVAPTGSGKTVTCAEVIRGARQKQPDKKILFVAHRRELIGQCSEKLDLIGVDHGVMMGSHWRRKPHEPVQVCSIQTLLRRNIPPAGLIIVDECHRAVADSYKTLLAKCPGAKLLGLTATPVRTDGRGLGELFNALVVSLTPADLTERGWLVPTRVFAPSTPDLTGVHIRRGDYDQGELSRAIDKPRLVGDVVDHWHRCAYGRSTVVFATGVSHSKHIVERFSESGVAAEHIDGKTPDHIRDAILKRAASGETTIVSNCGVWIEGVDVPRMSCAILARPTKSLTLYLQAAGRVLRPFPGKSDAIIMDHAGCTLDHGFVTDERAWSLDGFSKAPRGKRDEDEDIGVRICLKCLRAYPTGEPRCPECGEVPPVKERKVDQVDGELVEISPYTIRHLSPIPEMAALQRTAAEFGYKPGWVWMNFNRMKNGLDPSIPFRAREFWEGLTNAAA